MASLDNMSGGVNDNDDNDANAWINSADEQMLDNETLRQFTQSDTAASQPQNKADELDTWLHTNIDPNLLEPVLLDAPLARSVGDNATQLEPSEGPQILALANSYTNESQQFIWIMYGFPGKYNDIYQCLLQDPRVQKVATPPQIQDVVRAVYLLANPGKHSYFTHLSGEDKTEPRGKLSIEWAKWALGADNTSKRYRVGRGGMIKPGSHFDRLHDFLRALDALPADYLDWIYGVGNTWRTDGFLALGEAKMCTDPYHTLLANNIPFPAIRCEVTNCAQDTCIDCIKRKANEVMLPINMGIDISGLLAMCRLHAYEAVTDLGVGVSTCGCVLPSNVCTPCVENLLHELRAAREGNLARSRVVNTVLCPKPNCQNDAIDLEGECCLAAYCTRCNGIVTAPLPYGLYHQVNGKVFDPPRGMYGLNFLWVKKAMEFMRTTARAWAHEDAYFEPRSPSLDWMQSGAWEEEPIAVSDEAESPRVEGDYEEEKA